MNQTENKNFTAEEDGITYEHKVIEKEIKVFLFAKELFVCVVCTLYNVRMHECTYKISHSK